MKNDKNIKFEIDIWKNRFENKYGFKMSDEKWNEIISVLDNNYDSILGFLEDYIYENYIEWEIDHLQSEVV
tara:strand:- start:1 stop:213 length:213 start_codon:yes stop_codon:yes gene_type:complete